MSKLILALQAVTEQLSRFATGSSFWSVLGEVFGVGRSQAAAHAIQDQLNRGALAQLARVEVISAAQLGPARAAYASANGTIYLSDRFLAEASQAQLQAALLEEFGHAIDARVNASDRPGDEGELFSLRVRGITPSASERQRILAEDDRRTVTINGVTLAVEQAAPVVYETSTISGATSSSSFGFALSGLNAVWQEQRNSLYVLKFFNGTSTSTIATSPYQVFGTRLNQDIGKTAISGSTVAYSKFDGQDYEVYRYSGGTTTRITTNTAFDTNVLIEGSTIVWQSFDSPTSPGEIYRYNGTTTTRITTNDVSEEDVQLSGTSLLWAASDGNDYEIYLNNGTTTQQLTNNAFEDYSPVLSGNRAAWLQWNGEQANLLFYNGSTTAQVTSNLDVFDPLILGNNLLYKQLGANGDVSLKLYNATTLATTTLSSKLGDGDVQASGSLVVWLETNSSDSGGSVLSSLKLFNGSSTKTIATNALGGANSGGPIYSDSRKSFILNGSKVLYVGQPTDSASTFQGELFLYDNAITIANSTQITVGETISAFGGYGQAQISGNQILWSDGDFLKLSQPTTKPILSFTNPTLTVVEGFVSPQNATLTVTLSAASSVPVTVGYETYTNFSDPSPAFSNDYTDTEGTLTFNAGVTSQTINVPITNDNFTEPDKRFYVRLSAPSNAVLVPGSNTATVTITDTLQATGSAGQTIILPAGVENLTLTGTTNINGVGNTSNNTIRGNSGNNRLNGGGGFDELIGGLGNDTYLVNVDSSFSTPKITENSGEGVDTVEYTTTSTFGGYTLGSNMENLVLLGTSNSSGFGNELNNLIRGNSGNNFLDGGDGIDTVSYEGAPGPSGVTVSLTSPFGGSGSASGWGSDSLSGFENIIGSNFADTLTGDGSANTLTGNAGKDSLTGGAGADKFGYRTLSHSLLAGFDRILDFDASLTGDRFLVSTARAGFFNGGQVTTLLSDAALTAAAISSKLTTTNFLPNFAATVTMGSGVTGRTFMVINDAVAGFSATTDAVIEVSGFTGAFGPSMFVTS